MTENLCACGCGASFRGVKKHARYILGHQSRRDPIQRFMAKVEPTPDGCWRWVASLDTGGYGSFKVAGIPGSKAHRIGYILLRGPIPAGLHIDHLCRNRWCVNPDHMEPVTQSENNRRSVDPRRDAHRAGTCLRGHDRASNAVLRRNTNRIVYCKACRRDARAARRGEAA